MSSLYFLSKGVGRYGLLLIAGLCFLPIVNAPLALILGIVWALFIKVPPAFNLQRYSGIILKVAIVLMGFGMSLSQAIETSTQGFKLTAFSVILTLSLGILIGKLLKVDGKTTLLISVGTAICGGSAIAAVSPILDSKSSQMSFALIVVFVLNAIALFTFPYLGHYFDLGQEMFGNWIAIAIHDTSSVVGAGEVYGEEALAVATTVKLTRALWIIPTALLLSISSAKGSMKKMKLPWFILLFVLAMYLTSQFPQWTYEFDAMAWLGRKGMVVALLFIGAGINVTEIRKAGLKPFVLGVTLWVIISIVSLKVIGGF